MTDDFAAATPRPWFVHDFTELYPTPDNVTVSCVAPDSITVASMARALTATLDEARANAALIVAAVNSYRAEPSDEDVERVARAIEPELFKPIPSSVMWNPLARRMAKRAARDKARAAITALRAKP